MVKRDSRYPFIDRKLDTFRAFSAGVFLWWLVGAALLFSGWPAPWGGLCAAIGVVSFSSSLAMPLVPLGWRLTEVTWALTFAAAAVLLAPTGWYVLAAIPPLLAVVWMLRMRRSALARLSAREPESFVTPRSEVPRWQPCETCGSRQSQVVAPLYVLSLISVSFRWPGKFRSLCAAHARIHAIPALLCSLVLGPLGIPWGVFWAFEAVQLNWDVGGVTLDSDVLADMRAREAAEGGLEEPSNAMELLFGLVVGGALFAVCAVRFSDLVPA